jgi:hypothetical protein
VHVSVNPLISHDHTPTCIWIWIEIEDQVDLEMKAILIICLLLASTLLFIPSPSLARKLAGEFYFSNLQMLEDKI